MYRGEVVDRMLPSENVGKKYIPEMASPLFYFISFIRGFKRKFAVTDSFTKRQISEVLTLPGKMK